MARRLRQVLWTGPEALERHIAREPKLRDLMRVMFLQVAPATCERLGAERLSWLRQLPAVWYTDALQVLHSSPGNPWWAPMPDAPEEVLTRIYGALSSPLVVYGIARGQPTLGVGGRSVRPVGDGLRWATESTAARQLQYDLDLAESHHRKVFGCHEELEDCHWNSCEKWLDMGRSKR